MLSHNSTVVSGVFVGSNIQRAAEKPSFYALVVVFFFFQGGKDLFHLTDYLPPSREVKARGLKKRKPQREKYCLLARSFAHIQLPLFYNQGPPARDGTAHIGMGHPVTINTQGNTTETCLSQPDLVP